MADFTIKDPPEYNPLLRKLETTDPNHADVFNALFGQLINNDVFLVTLAQKTAEALLEHCDDSMIHVTAQDKQEWDAKAGTAEATTAKAGLMAAADKTKLDGVAAGAEVNQNAYGSIKVGNVTVTANGKTATFTLEAGNNIALSADNAAKKIIITADRDGGNADTVDGYHAASLAKASEVEDLKKSVSDGKTAVASAVTAKGVTTAASATFATITENIGKIGTGVDTSDATATDGEVLSGKTFYAKGAKITGKMTNRGAVTQALNAGGSYTIPKGYHNGSGKVTGNSLASQTGADAVAADILSGKTAWVNGTKVTGTLTLKNLSTKITSWGTTEGKNQVKVYEINTGVERPYILLSDLINLYTDFNAIKIITNFSYGTTNAWDFLILTSDTYGNIGSPTGATDITAYGNRQATTTTLVSTLTSVNGFNTTILDAVQASQRLGAVRVSGSGLTVGASGTNPNKIAIAPNSKNMNHLDVAIYIC